MSFCYIIIMSILNQICQSSYLTLAVALSKVFQIKNRELKNALKIIKVINASRDDNY